MPSGRARLRVVRQLELGDCGAACLATVLSARGVRADLPLLRELTRTGRDGVSARGLLAAAGHFGLTGRAVRCPVERLSELPPGAVLHWGGNHFVVLEQVTRRGARVLDPALGRRTVSTQTLQEQYSGVALLLEGDPRGTPATPSAPRVVPYRSLVRGGARPALLAVVFAAVVQAFALVTPLVLRRVVEDADNPAANVVQTLTLLVVAVAVGFLLAQIGRLLCLVALQRLVDVRLTVGVLRHLASLPYDFLARRSVGDLALRVRSTVAVRQILTSTALSSVLDGTLVLLLLVGVAVVDVTFAVLTVAVVLAQVLVVTIGWRRLREAAAEALEAQSQAQGRLLELVGGMELLKATGRAVPAVDTWSERLEAEVAAQARSTRVSGLLDAVLLTLRFAAPPALLVLALARLRDGDLALGDVLALAALSAAITVPTGALLGTVCALASVLGYLERLDDLLRAPAEATGTRRPPRRLRGAVELQDVTFGYSKLLPPAVEGISATIEPGERVLLVGASGSGKTTLALLVATLHAPWSGRVLIDGVDARDYDLEQLRRRIGVVTQDVTLFGASVRDNIVFGRSWLTDRDVEAAADAAVLHDDLRALPAGYATVLGNGGAGLSGGQRQRLALARALAGRPGLLVLDEATSALDPATERLVQDNLSALGCTRVIATHRLSGLAAADRVLVLDAGQLVADGRPVNVRRRNPQLRALLQADRQPVRR